MDRLYMASVDIVTQNQQTVHCEVLTDSGQTLHDFSGHSDTEPTDGVVWGTDRHWTGCRRQHCA
jgi:hypothetical protein